MQQTPFELEYQLQTLAPLRLPALPSGTPASPSRLAGSLIKGATRRSASTVAALLNMHPCLADADPGCTLCRLFGAPGREAALHWSPATIVDVGLAPTTGRSWQARHRRPVDRASGVGTGEPAPSRVALPAGLMFEGRLQGWLAGDGIADAAFVVAALQHLEHVGGGQSGGHGRVGLSVGAILLAGEPRTSGELLGTLLV